MTREEAIGVLEDVRDAICENIPGNHPELDELKEAVQMAVNALAERKKGKWLETDSHEPCWYKCDQCGRLSDIKEIYCPTCGASMVNTTCGADMRGET